MTSWSCIRVFALSAIVLLAYLVSMYTSLPPSQHHTLPYHTRAIVGRENEVRELKSLLQHYPGAPRIVSITGGPGFGKSTLALSVGHELETEGMTVIHVDLNDEITTKYEIAAKIALRIDRESELSVQIDSMQKLMKWTKSLSSKTLLILDNCDEHFHVEKDALQSLIVRLLKQSKDLKVLTTSRRQVAYIEAHKLYPINELSESHACELLHQITKSLNEDQCADIARLTGSVPLALHVVGALLNMPNPPSPQRIINQLNESLIRTLSPEELRTTDTVDASIFLSYQYLDSVVQKSARYLSHFPGLFGEDIACIMIKSADISNSHCEVPRLLITRSLLKSMPDLKSGKDLYVFHRLVREFFREKSKPKELERFNMFFIGHYTSELARISQSTMHILEENWIVWFVFNRQDLKHFFHLLSNNATFSRVHKKEAANVIMQAAEAIGNIDSYHILDFGFPPQETREYLKNLLNVIDCSWAKVVKYFKKRKISEVCSKIIVHLLRIEKRFISNKNALIQSMNAYHWVFQKYGQFVPLQEYTIYFATLAAYYFEIDDCEQAIQCHEMILKKDEKRFMNILDYLDAIPEMHYIKVQSLHSTKLISAKCIYHEYYSVLYRNHNRDQVEEKIANTGRVIKYMTKSIMYMQNYIRAIRQSLEFFHPTNAH